MTKEDEMKFQELTKGMYLSEIMSLVIRGENRYNRRILFFFKWFCKWMPVFIMLVHWAAMYDFGQNHYDMFEAYSDNWVSYTFTYFMLYVLPMVIILASRFFWLCWRYRIPFIYFFGVNAIHIAYWNWYTTNEMVTSHYALMIMVVVLYLYAFVEIVVCKTKLGRRICA